MTNARRPLVIDLDPGSGPPTGRICDATGIAHPFSGWLGFASVLGQLLEQDRSTPRARRHMQPPNPGGTSS
jgi:hypothetical protein